MEVKIEKLDHQARGICFIDGKITFVENTLPGEIADIKIINQKKKYNEASLVKMIKISKDRIESKCPHYKECGGCDLQHINYNNQLNYKNKKIKDIMKKYANIDNVEPIVESPNQFNYRNKITLKVQNGLGFYKRRTNSLVLINECLLANNKINKIIKDLNQINNFKNINEISIRNINSSKTALTLYLHESSNIDDIQKYSDKNDIILNTFIEKNHYNIKDESKILAKLDTFEFIVSPLAFFQVNTEQTLNLYNKVLEYLDLDGTQNILDLYCGTGTIGIFASKKAKKVLGIEISKSAIEDAKTNKKINNISNIDFICGDTEKVIKEINQKFHAIIVDPPRSGLTTSIIKDIYQIKPEKIVYVSCDPITLARDLNILKEKYEVLEITPFDMFPNTYHVETVVKLKRSII
ncbi:MAG: 23S rRNA (uracil(1939)-C(5))-methyltransferase RlmD [Bacilli bacterium]